jgi:hypothetical protein
MAAAGQAVAPADDAVEVVAAEGVVKLPVFV